MLIIQWIFLIVGFAALIFSADQLVQGAVAIAKKLKMSEVMIGLTIISIGTSMPELLVSVLSSVRGNNSMALGNILGSNIFNLLMILGLTGMCSPKGLQIRSIQFDIILSGIGVVALAIFSGSGMISRWEALILLGGFIFYIRRLVGRYKTVPPARTETVTGLESVQEKPFGLTGRETLKSIGLILLGMIGLVIGGQLVISSASNIALALGMSEKLVSVTILALGTSLPELVTSIAAVKKGNPALAVGNVIGSNILNIYFILGTTSLILPMAYNPAFNLELIMIGSGTLLLLLFLRVSKKYRLDRWEASILFAGYIGYMIYNGMTTMLPG